MTKSQQEHFDGGYMPLITVAGIVLVVVIIVAYEVHTTLANIPPGEIQETCGLGCTGEPVVTPLVAVLMAVAVVALLVRLHRRDSTEDEDR